MEVVLNLVESTVPPETEVAAADAPKLLRRRVDVQRRRELKQRVAAASEPGGERVLDLSRLELRSVPGRALRTYPEVEAVDVSHNAMRGELCKEFCAFTQLRRLAARDNKLDSLPDSDGGVESLREWEVMDYRLSNLVALDALDLSGNAFVDLPIAAASAPVLRTLNLARNRIGPSLDEIAMASLTSLRVLDLSDNRIAEIPNNAHALVGLEGLETLILRGNALESLPAKIGKLTSLTALDVRGNALTSLPRDERTGMPSLGKLIGLQRLDLADNAIAVLGDEVGSCTALTALDVGGNALEELPAALGALGSLTSLRVGRNALVALPTGLPEQLTALTELDLSSNALTELPPSIAAFEKLEKLDVSNNALTELPADLGFCTHLVELQIHHNALVVLPENLGKLTKLTALVLGPNELTALPASIGLLAQLRVLSAAHNAIAWLPDEITQLRDLTVLDLSENKLKQLPSHIGAMMSLRELVLRSNSLRGLPRSIGELESLVNLDLSRNKFEDAPVAVAELLALTILSLAHNRLTTLPDAFDALIALCGIDLSANKMVCVPPPIVRLANRRGAALRHCRLDGNPTGRVEDAALRDLLTQLAKRGAGGGGGGGGSSKKEAEADGGGVEAAEAPHPLSGFSGSVVAHSAAARKLTALGGAELFEAIEQLTRALESTPHADGVLLYERAMLQLRVHHAAAALMDCNSAIAHGFVSAAVYVCRARAEQELGKLTDAIASCGEAIVAKPTFSVAYCLRATLYLAIGRNMEARKDAEVVLLQVPGNVTARFTLGRALLKLRLPQQAADEFVRVMEIVEENGGECGGLPHYYRAVAVLDCSLARLAIDCFSHAIVAEEERDTAADVRLLCDAFTGRSAVLLEAGNMTRSTRDFESAERLRAHLNGPQPLTSAPTTLQKMLRRLQ